MEDGISETLRNCIRYISSSRLAPHVCYLKFVVEPLVLSLELLVCM